MDAELRSLERELRLMGGDGLALERARLRAGLEKPASLADFIHAPRNARGLAIIEQVAARRKHGRFVLEGPPGTGKSLLLRALHQARADSLLWTGAELEERGARALQGGERLDLPRLIIIDDLASLPDWLGLLLRASLDGATLVAAGAAARAAARVLRATRLHVGPLDVAGRRALFVRALAALGAARSIPPRLPASGFEVLGLARSLVLETRLALARKA
jgi:hypothetical protein